MELVEVVLRSLLTFVPQSEQNLAVSSSILCPHVKQNVTDLFHKIYYSHEFKVFRYLIS